VMTYDLLVDPSRLVRVRFVEPVSSTELTVVAITCAYVPAVGARGRAVAVEIVADLAMPNPGAPYYCPPTRLTQYLIPPRNLRGIQPYSLGERRLDGCHDDAA
jgi:hypothetical protein